MPPLAELSPELSSVNETPGNTPPKSRLHRYSRAAVTHVKKHVGVGIVCSVAYFDPGNWSVDLQAGSQFGYRPMLFVVLLAGLGAIVLQSLASKLGCVTGLDLASHCRLLLHDRPQHRRLIRFLLLYPLYALCEIAIISTDLAELLGSAIGLCLLFPSLPLWSAVLLTACDVFIFLIIGDPSRNGGRPAKLFEISIIVLVLTVFVCFVVLLVQVQPDWSDAFMGYIPSAQLFDSHTDVLYTAVGILGATVMPHGLFLGSFLATQNRIDTPLQPLPHPVQTSGSTHIGTRSRLSAWWKSLFAVSRSERILAVREYRNKYGRENNELVFVKAHLSHGLVDIVTSLFGIAVPINSAILILAAAVFFHGEGTAARSPASLFDAYDLIKDHIGKGKYDPKIGEPHSVMRVRKPQKTSNEKAIDANPTSAVSESVAVDVADSGLAVRLITVPEFVQHAYQTQIQEIPKTSTEKSGDGETTRTEVVVHEEEEYIDFSNGRLLTSIAVLIFIIVLAANLYVFVVLGQGKG
ncbi:hypothetical protein PHLCEN_2v6652 [Hermanssonia centrifuga]|uniref:Natural resistance-associated macrophage protein n=1 Tax=Hermanssonia centrifuga TaxID=98765 RepID=A0A2R6NYW4_9APHY|nr:hypothetical protein PHLCEN_2v6652 [Hermanssonia centrifuga]